ncbi:MAG: hypothetical protein KAI24_19260 [Planctomycetes bacterium]|nr:hypothetical protein [Planctomycetota bacterium]
MDVRETWHLSVVYVLDALTAFAKASAAAPDARPDAELIADGIAPGFELDDGAPEPYATVRRHAFTLQQRLAAEERSRQSNSVVYRDFRMGGHATWAGQMAASLHEAILSAARAAAHEEGVIHEMAMSAALQDQTNIREQLRQEYEFALLVDPVHEFHTLALQLIEESSKIVRFFRHNHGSSWPELQQQVPVQLRKPVLQLADLESDLDTARYERRRAEGEDAWYGDHAEAMRVARRGCPKALDALRQSLLAEIDERIRQLEKSVATAKKKVARTAEARRRAENEVRERCLAEHRAKHARLLPRYRRRFEQFRPKLAGLPGCDLGPLGPLARGTASACHVAMKFAERVADSKWHKLGDLDIDQLHSLVERELGWLDRNVMVDADRSSPRRPSTAVGPSQESGNALAPLPVEQVVGGPSTQEVGPVGGSVSRAKPSIPAWHNCPPKHQAAIRWLLTQPRGEAFTRAQILTEAPHLHLKGDDRTALRQLAELGILDNPPQSRDLRLERLPEGIPVELDRHPSWLE